MCKSWLGKVEEVGFVECMGMFSCQCLRVRDCERIGIVRVNKDYTCRPTNILHVTTRIDSAPYLRASSLMRLHFYYKMASLHYITPLPSFLPYPSLPFPFLSLSSLLFPSFPFFFLLPPLSLNHPKPLLYQRPRNSLLTFSQPYHTLLFPSYLIFSAMNSPSHSHKQQPARANDTFYLYTSRVR